jgi:hypothetical protein
VFGFLDRTKLNTMKKMILSALIACFFFTANAQFGVRAGVNFQTLTGKDNNGNAFTNSNKTGFHVGINYSIPIATDFSVRPEVLYSGKGAKSPANNDYSLNYLEIPLNLIYKPSLGTGHLMLGAGPYVAFGLDGNVQFTNGAKDDVKFADNVTTPTANTAYYKSTDAGINFLGGYEFTNKLSLQVNAQVGLMNIYPQFNGVQGPATLKNNGFGLSVGYRF